MKKFITDEGFWELFPEATIGVLVAEGIQEEADAAHAAEIAALLQEANAAAEKYLTNDVISENRVVQVWREAYRKFPTKKGARCSIEALLKRVLHKRPVGSIAPTVDITNAISLKYAFPIGTENMDAFAGDLHLGIMKGDELFEPIGEDAPEPPLAGEVAYYDGAGVVCRCWNWRDGKRTMITDTTTREFIAMECIEPERAADVQSALDELALLLERYSGAKIIAKEIVTGEKRELIIEA